MNESLFQLVNSWAGQNIWLDNFMIFSSDWLGYILIGLLSVWLFKNKEKYRAMVIISLGSAVISRFVFVEAIRFFYNNPRPFLVLSDVTQLVNHEATPSFPSGHASFYFALATGVYLYNKKAGYAYFALAGLMGFARVFVGVHWPLDIIAGAGLGAVTAILINKFKPNIPLINNYLK